MDFGLSGRTLRPGCGTVEYGAPEVWLAEAGTTPRSPATAVDVYATACVAFELLTGSALFAGPNELAIVAKHLAHDGVPEGVMRLSRGHKTQDLGDVLCAALRRDPERRMGIGELRDALKKASRKLLGEQWPLAL